MRPRTLLAALVLLAGLSGCGQQASGTASAEPTGSTPSEAATRSSTPSPEPTATATAPPGPSPRSYPPCDRIWVEGRDLPVGYAGCREGGREVVADRRHCALGRMLVTYADRYYGVPGFRVNAVTGGLGASKAYRQAARVCSG